MRTAVVILFLLVTAVAVNFDGLPTKVPERPPLSSSLGNFGSWRAYDAPMDDRIVKALALDDFISRVYNNGSRRVELYIGYYHSSKKVSAPHSPLVCFPGQGWVISDRHEISLPIKAGSEVQLDATAMTASREGMRMRVLFWYQASDKTFSDSFRQKLSLLVGRMQGGKVDNALVRVSASIEANGAPDADQVIKGFVQEFYPVWHSYLVSD